MVSQLWCTGFEIITARDRMQQVKELEDEEFMVDFNGALCAGACWLAPEKSAKTEPLCKKAHGHGLGHDIIWFTST